MFRKAAMLIAALALPALAAQAQTTFKVRIENVSTGSTLKLSNGQTAPAPVSPGTWTISNGSFAVFMAGKPAPEGLESQAEEGNPEMLAKSLQGHMGHSVKSTGAFTTAVGESAPSPFFQGRCSNSRLRHNPATPSP
jgi:hypothetical protein